MELFRKLVAERKVIEKGAPDDQELGEARERGECSAGQVKTPEEYGRAKYRPLPPVNKITSVQAVSQYPATA